jgi:Ca2+-binding RTX toxin-like protein
VIENPTTNGIFFNHWGNDAIRTALSSYSLANVVNVENLAGTAATGQRLTGNAEHNVITGGTGNDTLEGSAGGDTLVGGKGLDTAVYSGRRADYLLTQDGGEFYILDLHPGSPDGADALRNVEIVRFADETIVLESLFAPAPTENADVALVPTSGGSFDARGGDDHVVYTGSDAFIEGGNGNDTIDVSLFDGPLWVSLDYDGREIWSKSAGSALFDRPLADLAGFENIVGTAFDDRLIGNSGDNRIEGGTGNDTLLGRGGDDILDGGAGTDTVQYTGFRSAYQFALQGTDILVTSATDGADTVRDNVEVFKFADATLSRAEIVASLAQTPRPPTANFTEGDDTVTLPDTGGTLDARGGDDVVRYVGGDATIVGGAGNDTIDVSGFDGPLWISLDYDGREIWSKSDGAAVFDRPLADLTGFENIVGTAFDDRLIGDGLDNRIDGGAGNDTLLGHGGNDILDGGTGTDTVQYIGRRSAYQFALAGTDILVTSAADGIDTVRESVEFFKFGDGTVSRADILASLAPPPPPPAADFTEGADTVTLPASGGMFNARGGDDLVRYVGGDAAIDGGAGNDTIDASRFDGPLCISLDYNGREIWSKSAADHSGAFDTPLADLTGFENIIGTVHSDKLWGDDQENVFFYTGGGDRIDGRGETDTADFSLFASAVWVDLEYTKTPHEAWTRNGPDLAPASGAYVGIADLISIENLTGTAHADLLRGNGGANRLDGGTGNDTLTGRGGNDLFVFGAGFGADTITDFAGNGAAAGDAITLALGAAFDSFAEVMAAGSQVGSNAVFDFGGGNTLTLSNTTLASLHQNDLLFG